MANIKSARKRIRINERKRMRNVMYRSRVKTLVKNAEISIYEEEPDEAAIREAIRYLDKAVNKGILHRNNAARRKSRLIKKLRTFQSQTAEAA